MQLHKRVSMFTATTLVALFASTFLFTGNVSAQSLDAPRNFGIEDRQPVVEDMQSRVLRKDYELTKEQLQLVETRTVGAELKQTIEEMRLEIEALESKVAQKKAETARAIEAQRLAEIERKAIAARQTYTQTYRSAPQSSSVAKQQSIPGNTYGYGYCTWHVKNVASWIPNGLGNANTWASRAPGYGLSVSSTPRAGAVGATTRGSLGHVVYVRSVNADGTVNISDMNYGGWNVVTYRTVPASQFVYIF